MASGRKSYGNIQCQKIYPVQQTKKEVSNLKTVAFQLTSEQAIDLAKKLLGAAQASKVIDVTGFRLRNVITVTTPPRS
jgi:hypothetical protein